MKFTLLFAAAIAAPTVLGAALLSTNMPTPSTPSSPYQNIGASLAEELIKLLSERGEFPATTEAGAKLEHGQYGPEHVYYPPPGEKWSSKTRCVIEAASLDWPIWRVLNICGVRHNGDPRGNTRIYKLCADEADKEGISKKEKYMRCERFKSFGKLMDEGEGGILGSSDGAM